MKSILTLIDGRDALLFVGLALLGGGLWLIHPPAALIADGVVLIYVAVAGAK